MTTYTIQLQAGPLTSSKSTENAAIEQVLALFVQVHGGPVNGTAQQQLDFIRNELISHILETAKDVHRRNAHSTATATANQDVAAWTWT